MKNCPVCHSDYNADECPECGWPDTATKHGLNDLISWADDGGRFIWLDEAIGELSTLREKAAKVDELEADNDRLRQEKKAILSVVDTVGLSASEWVARTAAAERLRDEWQAEANRLQDENERLRQRYQEIANDVG